MTLQSHELPTVVIINDLDAFDKDISTGAIYNTITSSGVQLFTDLAIYNIDYYDLIDSLLEIEVLDLDDIILDMIHELRISLLNQLDIDTAVTMLLALKNGTATDVEIELFFSLYLQQAVNDSKVTFRINIGTIPTEYDTDVEMYISGIKYYNCSSDIYCSTATISSGIITDIVQDFGRIGYLDTDLYSSGLLTTNLSTYICNSALDTKTAHTELTTTSGRLVIMDTDIFSTALGLAGTTRVDLKTRSIFTSNFFIERDRFTTASSIAWVDIIDYLYPINTENTYLYVEGAEASGIYFTDIVNGKRLHYDPLDDFYNVGVITYSLHAENSIGEVEEKDFYLLYGYDLQLDEVIDWGPHKRVIVRVEASNLVFCPNMESIAYDFITVDLKSFNLNCTIYPVGFVDLPVSIFPQSAAFFYGKTYTVKLQNVKDFAGNIMEDIEYTFTIEDPLVKDIIPEKEIDIYEQTSVFDGTFPDTIWRDYHNGFTKTISSMFHNDGLYLNFSEEDAGSVVFFTDYTYGNCECAVKFSCNNNTLLDRLYIKLKIHLENIGTFDIRRHMYSYRQQWVCYNGKTYTNYGSVYTTDITGLKIVKYNSVITLYYMLNSEWIETETFIIELSDDTFESLDIKTYFEFNVEKSKAYPAINVLLESISLKSNKEFFK